ncbi:hypothetical protein BJF78_33850 [Pseudonocardia sp. CNS-139]|nr:hypothetical protein BJF78_33850 [Pseudonocardia sp. CNS-139]
MRAPPRHDRPPSGIDPRDLDDAHLRSELARLHDTRHETLLRGSESALRVHTERMLALEQEFLRRFPQESAPDPMRTRAAAARRPASPYPAATWTRAALTCGR